MEYPKEPGARSGSPETAFDAARSMIDAAKNREALALSFITGRKHHGATADEVADHFGWERYSSRPRLSGLKARGAIADSGVRRMGAVARKMAVWVAKEFAPEPSTVGPDGQGGGE